MCYFKVIAETTGFPKPEVIFIDDYNVEKISSSIVEVSVKTGGTYTLTVTASNNQGQASDSIVLEGECKVDVFTETDMGNIGDIDIDTGTTSLKHDIISPSILAPEIKLIDHNGQSFQLSNLHGKVVLVFFGFSHCYGTCPVVMDIIKRANEKIGDAAEDVVVVMVSTDPENDTPESMKEFMNGYNSKFLGLLGTYDELALVWEDYEVTVHGQKHSSDTYVIDKKGMLRETFLMIASSDDIAADLKFLLAEN